MQFFPIYACNFACKYCHFSIPRPVRPCLSKRRKLPLELFKKCIDDMSGFAARAKTLRFVGMGEPLMHGDIARMVEYAKKANVANTVEIVSNGSLLTPELSDALIAAGLDRLVVSLQGITAEKYREITGVRLDFSGFLDKLRYFFATKKNTHVYLKIVDCALDSPQEEEVFFNLFGQFCDSINIEHTVPIFPGVPFNEQLKNGPMVSQFGLDVEYTSVCPQPFYFMQVNPDGRIVGCQSTPFPEYLGNAEEESLTAIWNGEQFHSFRLRMLQGRETVCTLCKECNIMNLRMFPEDRLDAHAEILSKRYQR
ncbi:radical SAM protein [Desulfovibrio sp. OttesenSCG-928-C14]|nr:radical SAM protein [Desulfovibrio sp. OttesenSCG-928-C14]